MTSTALSKNAEETVKSAKHVIDVDADDAPSDGPPKRARLSTAPKPSNSTAKEPDQPLASLLDFGALTSDAQVQQRMEAIASQLLLHHNLVVTPRAGAPKSYEILEVEFYLIMDGVHSDPFTHGTEEQRTAGRWYFHRVTHRSADPTVSTPGYREGSRKGLDLTMGGPLASPYSVPGSAPTASAAPSASPTQKGPRGGILLRTLRRVSDAKLISGPSLLVDEILRVCGAQSVLELVDGGLGGDTSAFGPAPSAAQNTAALRVVPRRGAAALRLPPIHRSPRIGLELSHPSTGAAAAHPRVVFVQRAYRFFTHAHLLTANGRAQTFLGLYRALRGTDRYARPGSEDALLGEVCRASGLKKPIAERYLADLKLGMESGDIAPYVGLKGKGASSLPALYLRMMGAAWRATERAQETEKKKREGDKALAEDITRK